MSWLKRNWKYLNPVTAPFALVSDLAKGVNSALKGFTGSDLTTAQKMQNQVNADEAEKARVFEKEQADTVYQRGVADMKNAGLNVALMYGNGASPAPVASGNAASASSMSSPSAIGDILKSVVQMTMQNKQLKFQEAIANRELDIKKFNAETDRQNANTNERKVGSDIELNEQKKQNLVAEFDLLVEKTNNEKLQGAILEQKKRFETASADQMEVLANNAQRVLDAELALKQAQTSDAKASASLKYAQEVAISIESGFKNKLYSEKYIDAVIRSQISEADIAEITKYDADLNAYVDFVKVNLMSGRPVGAFTLYGRYGKEFTLPALDSERYTNMARSLGMYGPTDISSSWSESHSFQYFGSHSHSGSSSVHYGSDWNN